ncbi:putative translation protein, beta-barrel domain superfamily [Helianthus annuus]|nr:putative translation protein, beta-barrel domain superfamily [Helianthus annuus]KAJ0688237.1 putative translation protein, beta-barrel domain superfamily [Helianthus annuus]
MLHVACWCPPIGFDEFFLTHMAFLPIIVQYSAIYIIISLHLSLVARYTRFHLVKDQVPIGSVDVRAVFSSGSGRIAGCMVTDGKVTKDCGVRVLRKGKTVFVGVLDSLRRIKEDVKEVNAGLECGIGVDDFNEWEEGDVIEAFNTIQKRRTLEEASSTMTAAFKEAGIEI